MILRFQIPQPLFLYGILEEDLRDLSAKFIHNGYQVEIRATGGEVKEASWSKPDSTCKWYRQANGFEVTVTDSPGTSRSVGDLLKPENRHKLSVFLHELAERTVRAIRNVGIVPEFPETIPIQGDLEANLRIYSPESSADGQTWTKCYTEPKTFAEMLGLGLGLFGRHGPGPGFSSQGELSVHDWERITESLEDSKEASPEDEFLTNTIGHLRSRNFRVALLEAVIGLEIVLTQYLRAYLEIIKKVPPKRIDKFLRTDLGLTARLSGILDLALHESTLKSVDLELVLKGVEWRNTIVHRTGKLPESVPEEQTRKTIQAILNLARKLAELREDILATTETRHIAQLLRVEGKMLEPWIWIKPWHQVTIQFQFFNPPPDKGTMEQLAQRAGTLLKDRDRRFDPASHLTIYFEDISGKPLGTYLFGKVHLPNENLLAPSN